MLPIDTGCSPQSEVFFYTAGEQTKEMFFYPLCVGHYFCDSTYRVQRNNFNSFLLIYIKKGTGYLITGNKRYLFHSEDVVIVDCYQPHTYATTKDSELMWFHFDGSNSRDYVRSIFGSNGPVCSVKNLLSFEKDLNRILLMVSSQISVNDILCSYYIVKLLTDILLSTAKPDKKNHTSEIIEDSISHINSHLSESLSLNQLSSRAGLSPYYFTRLFKKETGYTPHNYILQSRINIAKFYLKSSAYSVKEICYNSGFPTESSFCTTFKKICGMTPSEYRMDTYT